MNLGFAHPHHLGEAGPWVMCINPLTASGYGASANNLFVIGKKPPGIRAPTGAVTTITDGGATYPVFTT